MPTLPNKMPLPKELSEKAPKKYNEEMHAGLWFDKFFNKYDAKWQVPKDSSGKPDWIKTVAKKVGGSHVATCAERRKKLVDALSGKTFVAKTDWHFVTGLGNNHPVENGFAWHPTLGVPYLTGAAVKGLLRAWCGQWSDTFVKAGEEKSSKLSLWFGPSIDELNKKTADLAAGKVIFFDALPTAPVTLKADVMTPHYGKWYEEGDKPQKEDGSNVPADWHSPKPIPFLVVGQGQNFQFSVAKRPKSGVVLSEVVEELKLALEDLGAGAKTAVGYGRMSNPEDDAKEWLERTIELIKTNKDLKGQPEETFWKKALSEEYIRANTEIQKWVLPMIQKKWKALGIDWNNPKGGSAQKARSNFISK